MKDKVLTDLKCYLYGKRHNLEWKSSTNFTYFWIVIEVNLYREEYSLDDEYYSYKEEYNQEMVNFIKKDIT